MSELLNVNEKLVSVIVPIYNIEEYLRQCVDSILQQTYTHFELILVNDGSPDNCPEICDAYASQDSRIKVIHKKNKGLVSAVLAGIAAAQGNFIYFVDGDDWIAPEALQTLCKAQQLGSYDLVVSSLYRVISNQNIPTEGFSIRTGSYNKDEIEREVFPSLIQNINKTSKAISTYRWGKLYRKDILLKNISFYREDISLREDWLIVLPYILSINSMYLMPNTYTYYYRFNTNSLTHSVKEHTLSNYQRLQVYVKDFLLALAPKEKQFLKQLEVSFLNIALSQILALRKIVWNEPFKDIYKKIYDITNQSYISQDVDTSKFSFKLRFLFWLIKKKACFSLYIITLFLSIYMPYNKLQGNPQNNESIR